MPDERDLTRHERAARKIANHDRLVAMGQAVDRRNGGGKKKKRRLRTRRQIWVRRSLITVGVVVVLIVGGVVGDYIYLGSLVTKVNVSTLQTSGSAENILLIGSTSRCALKVQNPAYGLCSDGVNGVNSDIDMILHLVPSTHSVSLLSIPRDTFVPNAREIGANKIDAALYEGPSQLVTAIEEDFAIPINNYVELNFDTFADVVNALGGVKMYFPIPVYDAYSGLNIEHAGCYDLDGYRALQVVRARHLQIQPDPSNHDPHTWTYESLSDIARIRRTHEFLRVLAAKVAARGLSNPITDQNILTAVLPHLTADSGFSESKMASLAETYAHTSIANVPQYTYPGSDVNSGANGLLYQGYYYGDVVFPVQPNGFEALNSIFGIKPGYNSFTGDALPSPSSVKLTVENGTGTTNQAAAIANPLRAKGYDVLSTGDVTSDGPISETVVWYGGPPPPKSGDWTSPAQAAAQSVLAQLQGPAVLGYNPKMVSAGATVTVQTGTGVTVSARSTTATTTTTKHKKGSSKKTTTTTPSVTTTTVYTPPGMKNSADFTAPSATNMPIQPWDPRACNAAGTGPANKP
ncbi:MAG TPA: LCP family protein [Acidimicrobiales bacterium]|nr:LCP family protein [Acidimicrobiales bacterium]